MIYANFRKILWRFMILLWISKIGPMQAPKFQHITPILQSLHQIKVSKRIE